jgi:hypothetical protein
MREYDWRGLAMLTQQMSQLFEPSKARLMSKQQEHEMNIMLAKQAWKTQSERVDQQKIELKSLNDKISVYAQDLQGKSLKDLVNAGMKEGSTPEVAAEIHDNTAGKRLSEMQKIAAKYQERIREQQDVLNNMKLYDAHAKMGEGWVKKYKSDPTVKEQVDYYKISDKDGMPGLSYHESQQALNRYLKDTYLPEEGEDGMEVTVGKGLDGKDDTFRVKPEAVAFISGFNSTFDRDSVEKSQAIAVTKASEKLYEKEWSKYTDEELKAMYINNMGTVSRLNAKYKEAGKPSIGMFTEFVDGSYTPKDIAATQGYEDNDINQYIGSRTIINKAAQHLAKRQITVDVGNSISLDVDGIIITDGMLEEFGTTDPNKMYNRIISSDENKAGYEATVNAYVEFIKNYDNIPRDKRKVYIEKFNEWINK